MVKNSLVFDRTRARSGGRVKRPAWLGNLAWAGLFASVVIGYFWWIAVIAFLFVMPEAPMPDTGRVYAFDVIGHVVYVSESERIFANWAGVGSSV